MRRDRQARAMIGRSLSGKHLKHFNDVRKAKESAENGSGVIERNIQLSKFSAGTKFYTVSKATREVLSYIN